MVPPSEYLYITIGAYVAGIEYEAAGLIIFFAIILNFLGTSIWFILGVHSEPDRFAIPALNKYWKKIVRSSKFKFVMSSFNRAGKKSIFWLRLLPIVRSFISFPAGYSGIGLYEFCYLSLSGMTIWAVFWISIGAFSRASYDAYGFFLTIPFIMLVFYVYRKFVVSYVKSILTR